MNDQTFLVIRFLLYLDLMVLFGLPLFELYGVKGVLKKSVSLFSVWSFYFMLISVGILLSLTNMLLVAQSMSGVSDPGELTLHILQMVIGETTVGMSWVIRLAALILAFASIGLRLRNVIVSRYVITLSGGVALCTVAWGGHAAMNEGWLYYMHLLSDIIHLLAAGAWVGALAAFTLLLLLPKIQKALYIRQLTDVFRGFARTGSVIVVSIVITAFINLLCIVDHPLHVLPRSDYGQLLLIKTGLFFCMIMLAAANRFRLVPRLEKALECGNYRRGIALMRSTIITEFILSILVLAVVALLGTLSPVDGME
ncbi:copper homeostasis membrane protein CopD [Cronobacter turicensis]|uniref:copper homeostasis membrane protein CopD n=1 Tax=Cronobacter turicensis TaxID=413502 RepID=UPI000CFD4F3B|nr:copper homeostasis membrane protein CopD [Cronobacter turicensis]